MLIYKNTFENTRTKNHVFPIEDQYYTDNNLAVVADGITRDPVGVYDLSSVSFNEMLDKYPRPSGAEMAAMAITDAFKESKDKEQSLLDMLKLANENVGKLNKEYITKCDYLQNDYYGAVASAILIDGSMLHYAYICDCGVIVYDKNKNIKFKTPDDMGLVDKNFDTKGIPWYQAEARQIVRRDYRNKPNNKYSYGAITGEKEADYFMRHGSIKLDKDDIVVVYSDGFSNFLSIPKFADLLFQFNIKDFEYYVEKQSTIDYELFGKEKTLIIMKK
jgi:serine/threonine protein phosphatase PrpC